MCLNSVTKRYNPPRKYPVNHIGYKVFKLLDGLYSPVFFEREVRFELGIEYEDTCDKTLSIFDTDSTYSSGFHIFESIHDASMYRINGACAYGIEIVVEVEYNNVVAEGVQGDTTTVVARTMKLIREVN